MNRLLTTLAATGAVATAVFGLPFSTAQAAGPFDGLWLIDLPQSQTGPGGGAFNTPPCAAMRLFFQVKDGAISARLKRVPDMITVVENSDAPDATPVTGTIQPDGALHASWGPYKAVGSLANGNGEVTVFGSCGPRTGTATRIE